MYPSNAHILKTCSNLLKVLPKAEQSKPQILLLAGNVTPYRNDTDREMPFRQESNFYYLTGCDIPSSYLLVTHQDGTSLAEQPSVHLFIPPISEDDLMWSVPPPSLAAAKEMHQATQYSAVTDLPNAISTLLKAFPNALFHTLPGNNNFPAIPEAYTSLITSSATVSALPTSPRSPRATSFNLDDGGHGLTELYLQAALHLARLTKDESEIELVRKANAISSRAHETVMRVLGNAAKHGITSKKMGLTEGKALLPGQWLIEKEAEAEAIFVASCRREGYVFSCHLVCSLLIAVALIQCSPPSLPPHCRFLPSCCNTSLLL
jgi:Xaa-Pro dipeptidase